MTDEGYRTSEAVVGPLPTVQFQDGTRLAYTPPHDTLDKRVPACTEHRVACDCREAEFAEWRAEYSAVTKNVRDWSNKLLRGHYTWAYDIDGETDFEWQCTCTGCQLARHSEAMRTSWDQEDEGTTLYPSLYADPEYVALRKDEEERRIGQHRAERDVWLNEVPF